MTNEVMTKKYDLEERTRKFGIDAIRFAKQIPESVVTRPLISQLVRSATSVGSNYCEADDAESRKDFKHKIGICKKEARETKHWLKMIATADPIQEEKVNIIYQEAKELNLIFNAIVNSTNRNS
jgi:four helix bundle protein